MSSILAVRRQMLSKLPLGLLALSVLILTGSLAAGLFLGDVRGYAGFGMLGGSIAVAASSMLSMWAPDATFAVARKGWLLASIIALAMGLMLGGEAGDTVLTYAMIALGPPASLVVAPLAGAAFGGATRHPLGLFALWLALFLAGYCQWYVLLPKLFRRRGSG